jgi:ketosteroid isomerase-like protein
MSQENVETVRRIHRAIADGDLDEFLAGWDRDCEFYPALEAELEGDGSGYFGHEGIRQWWQLAHDAWDALGTEIHEIREVGRDTLFVHMTVSLRGSVSGLAVDSAVFHVMTFRAGKVVTDRDFFDRAAALEAAGLRD